MLRVLIADKSPAWGKLLWDLLIDEYQVAVVNNLEYATQITCNARDPFHIVVIDIGLLWNISGNGQHSFLEKVRSRAKYTRLIILVSDMTSDGIVRSVSNKYDIPLNYRLHKGSESCGVFDTEEFVRIVQEAGKEALFEQHSEDK